MNNNNLNQWLAHIESFHPSEIKLGLDRIKQVASKLGLIDFSAKIVLVAGTNGKGSCVAMLESLALRQGKKVACYTSPHLLQFNERIRLNGVNIDDDALVNAFEQIELGRQKTPLTFFEFTTLAAFYLFQQTQLDLIILEVGLGGRQDATNIVQPDVSVITTVDRDHSDWLGDDLENIAYEKGGIIRAQKPALVGDSRTESLLRKVLPEYHSELMLVKRASESLQQQFSSSSCNPYCLIEQNLMLATMAYEHCFNQKLEQTQVIDALQQISLQGRFQLVRQQPLTIVDVGHNAQSAGNLYSQLHNYIEQHNLKRVVAICGMMADKAIEEVLSALVPQVSHWCFVDLASERAIKATELETKYKQLVLGSEALAIDSSNSFASLEDAYDWAIKHQIEAHPDGEDTLILVFGSFITVASMLEYQARKEASINSIH